MVDVEQIESDSSHQDAQVCVECGKEMIEPHYWYMNECDRCLKNNLE